MNNFTFQVPINQTSFGSIGIALLYELFKANLAPPVFCIGGPDVSAQRVDDDFGMWLNGVLNKSLKSHNRQKNECFRLWHCNQDAISSISDKEVFLTFIETDEITEIEQNILAQKKTVFVTSNHLKNVCNDYGLNSVKYLQIGFDHRNFQRIEKRPYNDDRIVHGIFGKAEVRKSTQKVIRAWAKKYGVPKTGVRPKHFLHAAVYNNFLIENRNGQIIDHNQAIMQEFANYGNIDFYPWLKTNAEYNQLLNSVDIVLGLSRGENIGLPEMTCCGLGKHAVMLNAHGYKDWITPENSVLVQPSGKIIAEDGIWFKKGNAFLQGNFYEFEDDAAIAGIEEAVKRYESNPLNVSGLELQKRTYKQTLDQILAEFN